MLKKITRNHWWLCAVLLAGVFAANTTTAQSTVALSDDKPFAEVHVIIQASQADHGRHTLVLDIANNLTKHYGGQDMVDIEVIAFGPGVAMLMATENRHADRIRSLMEHGVRFYVCGNTLDTITRQNGYRPSLISGVKTVQTGVAFMLEEISRGYTHIHP